MRTGNLFMGRWFHPGEIEGNRQCSESNIAVFSAKSGRRAFREGGFPHR
jgi:hypothetical protein